MKTIIRNYQLELPIEWLRRLILEYVQKHRYFVPYSYLARQTGWSQPVLWKYLDALGDQDVFEGKPRLDAFVGNDDPSKGHYKKKKHSVAYRGRWEQIQYLNTEIVCLCNHYRLQFLQQITLSSGAKKFFLRITGMWYGKNNL